MIDPSELENIWQVTDFYFTASMHEGFCVPVIEAMQRDVLAVACHYEGSSIEQTMGSAGVLCYGFQPALLAELIAMHNPHQPETFENYQNCIIDQRNRFNMYLSELSAFLSGEFFKL
jgi:hypothetical protein